MSDEYRGVAAVHLDGGQTLTVEVALTARFEPVEGRYRWGGRIAPVADLAALVPDGNKRVEVTVGDGPRTPARLGGLDPWGGVRLTGAGAPPWHRGSVVPRR